MIKLQRYKKNPIICPRKKVWWESQSVFNPGVIYHDGKVHMVYRALGGDRISRMGYCYSTDGYNFKGFKDYPVFESDPADLYERMGCEDARITRLEDKNYLLYTSASVHPATYPRNRFSTSVAPWRVRVSMLTTEDFQTYTRCGIVIPSVDTKDAVLFPEKINGQYVLLHRIWPHIWMAFSKDLKNWYDHRIVLRCRRNSWDSLKIGGGATPIKTEYGWLNFYHGIDADKIYRLGIVIFDLNDPTKVIYRSKDPIFEPMEKYEKEGYVKNVVFTCGSVEMDGKYLVYYGAADTCIGVATIDKDELLHKISKEM